MQSIRSPHACTRGIQHSWHRIKSPCYSPSSPLIQVRNATHAAAGRANGPKQAPGKRLGAKKGADEYVIPGHIIYRQRGTKWHPGENVGVGRDHTLYALQPGYVKFYRNPALHPTRQYVGVAFQRQQTLPSNPHAPRQRRLGMKAVERTDLFKPAELPVVPLRPGVVPTAKGIQPAGTVKRSRFSGRLKIVMRDDYTFRETNWSLGRIADRVRKTPVPFQKHDRWKAWRERTQRKKKNRLALMGSKQSRAQEKGKTANKKKKKLKE